MPKQPAGCIFAIVVIAVGWPAIATTVLAQNQPSVIVPGRPAPVPLPPPPQTNPQPPAAQPKIDTFSDKVSRCMHYGGTVGLPPGQLDSYTRACANN